MRFKKRLWQLISSINSLPHFPSHQQSLRYGQQTHKPSADDQPLTAQDIVTSHPLFTTTAKLSHECEQKLEIIREQFKKIGTTSPCYGNPSSRGTLNLMLTFLLVLALAVAQICFVLWRMHSNISLSRFDGNPMNCLKELIQREWKLFSRVLVCVSIIGAVQ